MKQTKGNVFIETEKDETKKGKVVLLTDETFPEIEVRNWQKTRELGNEFVKLIGRNEFDYEIQDFIADLSKLSEKIHTTGGVMSGEYRSWSSIPGCGLKPCPFEKKHIICLSEWLKPYADIHLCQDGHCGNNEQIHNFHLSRIRDASDPRMKVTGLPVNGGEDPEEIKKCLNGSDSVAIFDTIAFSARTINTTKELLGLKNPDVYVIGITPPALEDLKKDSRVTYSFLIDKPIADLWHFDDFFKSVETRNGKIIRPDELIEILVPYFEGEETIESALNRYDIEPKMKNPNLFLNAGPGGYVGEQFDSKKIIENRGRLKQIAGKIHSLIIDGYEREWGFDHTIMCGVVKGEIKNMDDALKRYDEFEKIGPKDFVY